jgi:hypothetical protein
VQRSVFGKSLDEKYVSLTSPQYLYEKPPHNSWAFTVINFCLLPRGVIPPTEGDSTSRWLERQRDGCKEGRAC